MSQIIKQADIHRVKKKPTQTLYHSGKMNRARYQPDQPNIIATKQSDGDILIYDRTKSDPLLALKEGVE